MYTQDYTSFITSQMRSDSKKMFSHRFKSKYSEYFDDTTLGSIMMDLYKSHTEGDSNHQEKLVYEMSFFENRTQFMKDQRKHYDAAKFYGLLDDYLPLKKDKVNKKLVMEFGATCKNKTDLYNKKQYYYNFALRHGFINEIQFTNESLTKNTITVESIYDLAAKCKNRTELSILNQSAYKKAHKLGILEDLRFNNEKSTIKYLWENIDTLTRDDIKKELSKHIKNPEPVGEF